MIKKLLVFFAAASLWAGEPKPPSLEDQIKIKDAQIQALNAALGYYQAGRNRAEAQVQELQSQNSVQSANTAITNLVTELKSRYKAEGYELSSDLKTWVKTPEKSNAPR